MSIGGADPVVTRLFDGNRLEDDLRGKLLIEPYKVVGMPPGDIEDATFTEAHFPALGSPHPRQPGAVLTGRRLIQWVNQNTAYFALIYRSNLPFGAAFRGASSARGFTRTIRAPRWRTYIFVTSTGIPIARTTREEETLERAYISLSYTVEIAGGTADEVVADSSPFYNHAFAINSIWWIYQGVSARSIAGNRILATHSFLTSGAVPGQADVFLPSGVLLHEIPALDPLDEYTVVEAFGSQAPATLVRQRSDIYVPEEDIDVLPGLPI